jgi:hypothetical protein
MKRYIRRHGSPPIGEAQRRPEAELWREFDIARPRNPGRSARRCSAWAADIDGLELPTSNG